jgi:hypothetical protein
LASEKKTLVAVPGDWFHSEAGTSKNDAGRLSAGNALRGGMFDAKSRKSVVERTDRGVRKEQTLVCLAKNIFKKAAEAPVNGRAFDDQSPFLVRLEE